MRVKNIHASVKERSFILAANGRRNGFPSSSRKKQAYPNQHFYLEPCSPSSLLTHLELENGLWEDHWVWKKAREQTRQPKRERTDLFLRRVAIGSENSACHCEEVGTVLLSPWFMAGLKGDLVGLKSIFYFFLSWWERDANIPRHGQVNVNNRVQISIRANPPCVCVYMHHALCRAHLPGPFGARKKRARELMWRNAVNQTEKVSQPLDEGEILFRRALDSRNQAFKRNWDNLVSAKIFLVKSLRMLWLVGFSCGCPGLWYKTTQAYVR